LRLGRCDDRHKKHDFASLSRYRNAGRAQVSLKRWKRIEVSLANPISLLEFFRADSGALWPAFEVKASSFKASQYFVCRWACAYSWRIPFIASV
jgi:hypothetical protein